MADLPDWASGSLALLAFMVLTWCAGAVVIQITGRLHFIKR